MKTVSRRKSNWRSHGYHLHVNFASNAESNFESNADLYKSRTKCINKVNHVNVASAKRPVLYVFLSSAELSSAV